MKEPGVRIRLIAATAATALLGTVLIAPGTATARPAIVGGATVTSAPWAAAVFATINGEKRFGCSGTIVAPTYVLTARHCIQTGRTMSVRVGSVSRTAGGATRTVTSVSTNNDLALMKLDSPVTTTYMALSATDPRVGATNTIFGWGRTCGTCDFAVTLKTATVTVDSLNQRDVYNGRGILSSQGSGYSWQGDSGGPQLNDLKKQVGVASQATGPRTDGARPQQVYASIAANAAWITRVSGVAVTP
jgi:secreted trypsin-like serine protease